ncbi:membrane-associated phosphatidylinositol transfer protein 2-like isoform X2 [Lethenteron reissneri]|uniref:membrane-associated phosphatidylinositol transfer protein 2-like isoform X2 n=1 Tax=Lethenteron reissneri TaxID=7753 RepID=UPI002AB79AE7|nr:membrane-associated phosphatidylinositol transfer protein 2-like isoform X2 [Lethenteron reissneri]
MLIKEYRIPLPMSVEEYRIAQLYMIQKKSRDETSGEGSGVEILENRPYEDGPGGRGQYTHKLYHIGMHIPGWFRAILPKAALRVEEQSWNAYPYTRTRYTCPFVEKFSIDIETHYQQDGGDQLNVFNLGAAEKRQCSVDTIDIVRDPMAPHEYVVDEDPRVYRSERTGRGPLGDDWASLNPSPIMCAYKLCKVEFRYWGMQSKIERFIHDVGLRKVMVRAHRQAWCWQDEWYGLTIADIRRLERETQLALAQKMAQYSEGEGEKPSTGSPPPERTEEGALTPPGESDKRTQRALTKQWSSSSRSSRSSKRGGSPSSQSLCEWRMQSIARESEDSSEEEFFDAQEDLSDVEGEGEPFLPAEISKWSSTELMDLMEATVQRDQDSGTVLFGSGMELPEYSTQSSMEGAEEEPEDTDTGVQAAVAPQCKVHMLVLLLHGGTILDGGGGDPSSKQADLNTFWAVFDTVMRAHFPAALGHVAIRLVPCPPVCAEAFSLVSNLSPYSCEEGGLSSSQEHVPLAALPLLATSSPGYQEAVAAVIARANQAHADFLRCPEGNAFNGRVCLIGDCVGGVLGFDALCTSATAVSESQSSSRRGSLMSVQDTDLLSPGIVVNSVGGGGSGGPGARPGGGGGGQGAGLGLGCSRHLSKSNIDIPHSSLDSPKHALPRKRSDSSTYEPDTIRQHHAFLSSLQASVLLRGSGSDAVSRRSSSSTMLDGHASKLDFDVSDFFTFGSPLGLVLALRRTVLPGLDVSALRPACQQVFNLFHPADPSACRLEPLLERRFHRIAPFAVARYQRFPLGDGKTATLADTLQSNSSLFVESAFAAFRPQEAVVCLPVPSWPDLAFDTIQCNAPVFGEAGAVASHGGSGGSGSIRVCARRGSEVSIASQVSGLADSVTACNIANVTARWWGTKRLDFALYCPDALTAFPTMALPHLFHASYWESTDVVAFILRQIVRHESGGVLEQDGRETSAFSPSQPREKWLRRRTHVKLRNVTANHRASDVLVVEDGPQLLAGRFMYGPLDMVTLTGEKVDVHIMTQPPAGEWVHFDTEVTNSSGRINYLIPESRRLGIGMYPVKMVVRGDHTFADCYLTVLPRGTECVVFSIDGSFAASVSIMGSDPKVRAGAVDVVRHWQDLGYLIVYVTGRPDMQKQRVVAWLAQHNFPHGLVSFCDGLVHDPLRHKANFLRSLMMEKHVRVHAAYGSTKDIAVYSALNLAPNQIYIVGRPTKKYQHLCQFLADGYAAHLAQLEYHHRSRPAKSNARMVLRKGSFGLPGQCDAFRKRGHLRRAVSVHQAAGVGGVAGPVVPGVPAIPGAGKAPPERALSQSEPEREQKERVTARSMSIVAAGCWSKSSGPAGSGTGPPGAAGGPRLESSV